MSSLFTALPVPPGSLAELYRRADSHTPLKWYLPENLHLTLRYFGNPNNCKESAVLASFTHLRFQPVNLTVIDIAAFPNANVIYAEVAITPELDDLHAHIASLLPHDLRALHPWPEFNPHITLCRYPAEGADVSLDECLARVRNIWQSLNTPWQATPEELRLYRSHGSHYTTLGRWQADA